MKDDDFRHLQHAIALSEEGLRAGEAPFGALIVAADGRILLGTFATAMGDRDPTAHAEVNAIRQAAKTTTPDVLSGATLYASTEPCAMCAAAIYWARIPRVVFGASEERLRGLRETNPTTLAITLSSREVLSRGARATEVVGPVLEDQAMAVLAEAWRRR